MRKDPEGTDRIGKSVSGNHETTLVNADANKDKPFNLGHAGGVKAGVRKDPEGTDRTPVISSFSNHSDQTATLASGNIEFPTELPCLPDDTVHIPLDHATSGSIIGYVLQSSDMSYYHRT